LKKKQLKTKRDRIEQGEMKKKLMSHECLMPAFYALFVNFVDKNQLK